MTTVLLYLLLWTAAGFTLCALWCAAVDGHRRGVARVHNDRRSWQPRPTRATSPDDVVANGERLRLIVSEIEGRDRRTWDGAA